jgi:iron complex outermembrane receptor protein
MRQSVYRIFTTGCILAVALSSHPGWAQQTDTNTSTATAPSTIPTNAPTSAQTNVAPSASEVSGTLQRITVTGSLIPRVGDGPQPVLTLDQDYIQKQGYQTVNDVLNNLPSGTSQQNALTFAGNSNSPASSVFGLRGLPANFTLVLLDGYRFPSYPVPLNTVENFVDLNSIPLVAIDRIEVLKDNGSATYGADAAAGVVNFILKTQYNGVDLSNYYGISQRGDFETYRGNFTAGVSEKLGGGNLDIVTGFEYYSQSPIQSVDRWYAYGDRSKLSPNYPDQPVAFFPAQGNFSGVNTGNVYQVKQGVTGPNITQNDFLVNEGGFNTYIPIDEELAARENRYGGFANVQYSPLDWLKFYNRFIITRNEETSTTPNQGFSAGDNIIIPANNPYNPWGEPLIPNGQLLREFGPWETDVISRTYREQFGVNLQLPHDWFIDANFLYGESDLTQTVSNSENKNNLQQALNGTLPGFEGIYFNPFTDENVSGHPNAIFYPAIRTQQIEDAHTNILQYTIKAGGTIWDSPTGPYAVAAGAEYRSEDLVLSNDVNSRNNNITSADFAGHLISASRYVKSIYWQFDAPLFGNKYAWPGLRNLDFTYSQRYDDYSTFGEAVKPKFALRYKPFNDLTFRLSYSEGFIAPTLGQLFGTPLQFQQTINDPKTNQTYNVLLTNGGNPNLRPQDSYGYYAEMVWTPGSQDEDSWWHWAKGFTGYIDWYEINVRGVIGTINPQTLVGAEDVFPGAVVRGANGLVSEIFANYTNVADDLTEGIEFGGSYVSKEYSWGKLDLELNGAYIYNFAEKTLLGNPDGATASFYVIQVADTLGLPDLKLNANLFYSKTLFGTDTFRIGFNIHYIDSEADFVNNGHGTIPAIDAGLRPPGYVHEVGSWTDFDFQVSYNIGPPAEITPAAPKPGYDKEGKQIVGEQAIQPKPEGSSAGWRRWLANTTVTFGIDNVGDTRPPLSVLGGNFFQGYDTQQTSPVQRFFYFQIEKKF